MTVPDYIIIGQTIAVEYQQSQSRHTSNGDPPEPRPRSKPVDEIFPALRRQVSLMLRVAADRVDPDPDCRHQSRTTATHLQVLK